MRKVKLNSRFVYTVLAGVFILLLAVLTFFSFQNGNKIVRAGTSDNVSGFAWSENIGWISFNATDCDIDGDGIFEGAGETGGPAPAGCPTSGTVFDYGVNINEATGNFSGYGWSSNIGWVSFQENVAPPDGYAFNFNCSSACDSSSSCTACYNSTDGNVYGWAKALSLGDDGWIKMRKGVGDSGVDYGVSIDQTIGDFFGWAWNGNATAGTGIGWVSFNCSNDSSCVVSDYKVRVIVPTAPTILAANSLSCNSMQLIWVDNSNNETGFETQWSVDGLIWTSHTPNLNPNIESRAVMQSENTTYYFRVRALGGLNSSWEPSMGGVSGSTNWCPPALSYNTNTANCDSIELSWTYDGTQLYALYRSIDGGTNWSMLADDLTVNNYTDINIESGLQYGYYVGAKTDNIDSSPVLNISPCPNLPKWKEVKSN